MIRKIPLAPVLGWILAHERRRQGLSQSSIASTLSRTSTFVRSVEDGARELSASELARWEECLGLAPGRSLVLVHEAKAPLGRHHLVIDMLKPIGAGSASVLAAIRAALEVKR